MSRQRVRTARSERTTTRLSWQVSASCVPMPSTRAQPASRWGTFGKSTLRRPFLPVASCCSRSVATECDRQHGLRSDASLGEDGLQRGRSGVMISAARRDGLHNGLHSPLTFRAKKYREGECCASRALSPEMDREEVAAAAADWTVVRKQTSHVHNVNCVGHLRAQLPRVASVGGVTVLCRRECTPQDGGCVLHGRDSRSSVQ
ncbi:hypothetical protein C8Q73DRAFT_506488 [Cubamyces lactineus]|nr:hypothetical protein C8Q73DRAFT_506488 [Cubamyces lactineus]